ncbi:hypothetical protein HK102_000191 [Quaeritorhiza haematococci]|nr:hypothetical protein HK102_000191 [Quaeritorhiza haematococci]
MRSLEITEEDPEDCGGRVTYIWDECDEEFRVEGDTEAPERAYSGRDPLNEESENHVHAGSEGDAEEDPEAGGGCETTIWEDDDEKSDGEGDMEAPDIANSESDPRHEEFGNHMHAGSESDTEEDHQEQFFDRHMEAVVKINKNCKFLKSFILDPLDHDLPRPLLTAKALDFSPDSCEHYFTWKHYTLHQSSQSL